MSIASVIAQWGTRSEKKLDKVLDETEALNAKLKGYSSLEDELDAAKSDGCVDASELGELAAAAVAAGVSPDLVEQIKAAGQNGPLTGDALDRLSDRIARAVKAGRNDLSSSESLLAFERNVLISDIQTHYTHASNVQKTEHDTYMAIIANMRA